MQEQLPTFHLRQMEFTTAGVKALLLFSLLEFHLAKGVDVCTDVAIDYLPCSHNNTLVGHVINTINVITPGLLDCQNKCFHDDRCKSYNLGPVDGGITTCELNDLDHVSHPNDVIDKQGWQYCPIENPCSSNPCTDGKSCVPDTPISYRCFVRSCKHALQVGHTSSGVYETSPYGGKIMKVYCDQETAGGGWTVIQRRKDGSVDFYRGWQDYKHGFGDLTGEFWLGLDNIHELTRYPMHNHLRVDLENVVFAEYDYFAVDNEANKYKLKLGAYQGTAGDSLIYHNESFFSTKDQDNDQSPLLDCSLKYKGAWWYNLCHRSNLNGLYGNTKYGEGINWRKWKGYYYSANSAHMQIRPAN